jgi:hypothetical protein
VAIFCLKFWFFRHSDEIVQLWEEGMKEEIESIGEEKWMVLEQVAWNVSIKYLPVSYLPTLAHPFNLTKASTFPVFRIHDILRRIRILLFLSF